MSLRLLTAAVVFCVAAPLAGAVLITNLFDPLDNANHFISAELDVVVNGNGTVTLLHTNVAPGAPDDWTALWGIDGGNLHLALGPSVLKIVPVESVISGTTTGYWGFDIVWFDQADAYLGQITYQSFTNATGLQIYHITSSVPPGAKSYAVQFRVFDQTGGQPSIAGYGFTFDSISAYVIPEPSVLGLALLGGAILFKLRSRRRSVP